MKVEVKKIDATKRELNFEVSKDRVVKKMDEIYVNIGKSSKVKGFRPGKVPRDILIAQYGDTAKSEAAKELMSEVYGEGIKQEDLFPIESPEIQKFDFTNEGGITFVATVNVKPEVTIKDYKGIKITKKSSDVTDEDINKALDYFKTGQGKDKEIAIDDAFAKGLGYPGLEELKKSLGRQLELDKEQQSCEDVERQVIEALFKKTKITVPQTLVEKEVEHRLKEWKERSLKQGVSQKEITDAQEDTKKQFREPVERGIKTTFIFDKIAEMENIKIKEGESLSKRVMEFLLKEAQWVKEGEK